MPPYKLHATRTLPTAMLLGILSFAGSCPPTSGPVVATYQVQTPYLSNVASSVQECNNTFYVSSAGGIPGVPFEIDLTATFGNSLVITKTVGSQTTTLPLLNPGPAGVLLPPYQDSYAFNPATSVDSTLPLVYDVVDIYPTTGANQAPPVQTATYSIVEKNNYATSAPITFNVQWGQPPPSSCWVSPKQPATSNLAGQAANNNTDFQLQFSSPVWQTGGNQASCSSPDTFEIQISSDSTFRLPARSLLLQKGAQQPPGPPPTWPAVPGGTTDQQFNAVKQWNFQCNYQGGSLNRNVDPLTLSFGSITAPDWTYANGNPNPMFFRVRGIYYGAVGPWSQAASFTAPAPSQNFNSGTDVCSFHNAFSNNPDTFPCIPWNFQTNVSSWELQIAKPNTTLGINASTSSLIQDTTVTSSAGGAGTASCGAFTGNGPEVNQFCGPSNSITNTNPYCAMQPAALPAGPFIWAIRAHYSGGHAGPWSVPFAGTWPGTVAVPNVVGQSLSNAFTQITNAGLTNCGGNGPTGPTSQMTVIASTPPSGTSACQGQCVTLTFVQSSGGGSAGSGVATITVQNSSDASVAVWLQSSGQWAMEGSVSAGQTATFSLTNGTQYAAAVVWEAGTANNGQSCDVSQTQNPPQLISAGMSACIPWQQNPVVGGTSGTLTVPISGSPPAL